MATEWIAPVAFEVDLEWRLRDVQGVRVSRDGADHAGAPFASSVVRP